MCHWCRDQMSLLVKKSKVMTCKEVLKNFVDRSAGHQDPLSKPVSQGQREGLYTVSSSYKENTRVQSNLILVRSNIVSSDTCIVYLVVISSLHRGGGVRDHSRTDTKD